MRWRNKKLLFDIQFWLVYFLYAWLSNASIYNEYKSYLVSALVLIPITFIAAYCMVQVLVKRFYQKGRKRKFWFWAIASIIIFTLVRRIVNYYFLYPLYFPEARESMPFLFFPKLVIELVNIYLIVGLYAMFYFSKAWYEQQRISQELQQGKVQAELELLKSQVHPHFIFNTLNNIYSLALQKNPETPDLIYRLSSFLEYNLYNSRMETISAATEIEYAKNYIELERVRFGNRLDVSFNVFNPVEGISISPMLLLPLVENCFKHGISTNMESAWIRMDVSTSNNWFIVKIENSTNNTIAADTTGKNGIGLFNVRRRLEILYPGNHEFITMQENNSYLVILKIKITCP